MYKYDILCDRGGKGAYRREEEMTEKQLGDNAADGPQIRWVQPVHAKDDFKRPVLAGGYNRGVQVVLVGGTAEVDHCGGKGSEMQEVWQEVYILRHRIQHGNRLEERMVLTMATRCRRASKA